MKTKRYFVSAMLSCALAYSLPGHALDGFESICTLDESCSVEKSTLVAFKSKDRVSYRTLSGNFLCSPATFASAGRASPKANDDAQCYAMTSAAASSTKPNASGADLKNQHPRLPSGSYAVVAVSSGKALAISDTASTDATQVVQQNFHQLPGQIWQVTALESGYYAISQPDNQPDSQLALESKDWEARDGAKLQQTTWINSWNQHWQLQPVEGDAYTIRSRFSGHALDVYEINNKHNAEVVLWTYWGGENQHWRLVPIEAPQAAKPSTGKAAEAEPSATEEPSANEEPSASKD